MTRIDADPKSIAVFRALQLGDGVDVHVGDDDSPCSHRMSMFGCPQTAQSTCVDTATRCRLRVGGPDTYTLTSQ